VPDRTAVFGAVWRLARALAVSERCTVRTRPRSRARVLSSMREAALRCGFGARPAGLWGPARQNSRSLVELCHNSSAVSDFHVGPSALVDLSADVGGFSTRYGLACNTDPRPRFIFGQIAQCRQIMSEDLRGFELSSVAPDSDRGTMTRTGPSSLHGAFIGREVRAAAVLRSGADWRAE